MSPSSRHFRRIVIFILPICHVGKLYPFAKREELAETQAVRRDFGSAAPRPALLDCILLSTFGESRSNERFGRPDSRGVSRNAGAAADRDASLALVRPRRTILQADYRGVDRRVI